MFCDVTGRDTEGSIPAGRRLWKIPNRKEGKSHYCLCPPGKEK